MTERATLLLVEDDRYEVEIALRALALAGVHAPVEVARDGLEALQILGLEEGEATSTTTPQVIFLDLKMPRVDGWEVLRRVRANPRTSELPVVVLSSSDRKEDIERSYAMGANSFLVKRFDRRGPGSYIADAAHYWLDLNRTPES